MWLIATQASAACPICAYPATKIQSRYERTLADLTWANFTVKLFIQVRRFYCLNVHCVRRVFCERLTTLTQAYARRTTRLRLHLQNLALALGGKPAARLAAKQNLVVGRSSLLRLLTSYELPTYPTPRVLGVDDFSLKRGRTYATLLVDLEKHLPIEVLADRTSETFAKWLEQHPGIAIISRDRASSYAKAALQSAPEAVQVADRFHLLQNLREHLDEFFRRKKVWLYAPKSLPGLESGLANLLTTTTAMEVSSSQAPSKTAGLTLRLNRKPTRDEQLKQTRLEQRLDRYRSVVKLGREGWSNRQIAQKMGIDRNTVNAYMQVGGAEVVAPRRNRPRPSMLDPYRGYIYARWCEEQLTVKQLQAEIVAQGYAGSTGPIRAYLAGLRPEPYWSASRSKVRRKLSPEIIANLKPSPKTSSRQAGWLVFGLANDEKEKLTEEQRELLQGLRAWQPEVEEVYQLIQAFRLMVREKRGAELEAWLGQVKASGIKELVSFSNGIERDKAAVLAGLTLEYSNGQLEGQVNRVKNIKRAMFGRAKFALLRQRILARS